MSRNAADAIPWYLSDFGVTPVYQGFKQGFQQVPTSLAELFRAADGEIRLVRWAGNIREMCQPGKGVDASRRVIATEDLTGILAAVGRPAAAEPQVLEHELVPG